MSAPTILFENRRMQALSHTGLLFENPSEEIICWDANELYKGLAYLETLRQCGYYLAGCLSYEAGYVLRGLPHLLSTIPFPLLHFFAFQSVMPLEAHEVDVFLGHSKATLQSIALNITPREYEAAFSKVQDHITAGDTYQVNLTAKYAFEYLGSSRGLYNTLRLRQKVAYSALLEMPNYEILSLSPELFFSKIKHKMHAKPMKGTMARVPDAKQDALNQDFLRCDLKSRAENTMIVDLLRNDLSAISNPGSVTVSQLLTVESYETVHQMTTSLESEVAIDVSFTDILKALFPCGSITGAPKRRTMELIHTLEATPRHVYTGAIGYITPDNDMCFNVPIRTALCKGGHGELGVGGGIVHDSDMHSEFEELQLKARFLTALTARGMV